MFPKEAWIILAMLVFIGFTVWGNQSRKRLVAQGNAIADWVLEIQKQMDVTFSEKEMAKPKEDELMWLGTEYEPKYMYDYMNELASKTTGREAKALKKLAIWFRIEFITTASDPTEEFKQARIQSIPVSERFS